MRRLLLGLGVFLTIFSQTIYSKTQLEYWRDSGLTFSKVREVLTENACKQSERAYLSCIYAANQILERAEIPQKLLHDSRVDDSLYEHASYMDLGAGTVNIIAKVQATQETIEAETAFQRREEEKDFKAWRFSYARLTRGHKEVDFDTIFDYIETEFMSSVEAPMLAGVFFNSYLSAYFDPHTYIMPKQVSEDTFARAAEVLYGVGVRLVPGQNGVEVYDVFRNGPAMNAGLHYKDVFKKIDGEDVSSASIAQVSRKLMGELDTYVEVEVERRGRSRSYRIKRGRVVSPVVDHELLYSGYSRVLYISFSTFSYGRACDEIESIISAKKHELGNNLKGLVLDLRGNLGGLVDQAVCIAGLFLPKRSEVLTARRLDTGRRTVYRTNKNPVAGDLPMVTLIDHQSASASEILSGALQDHQRSLILGVRSYGKGSVQYTLPSNFGPGLNRHQTLARFYLPSGRTNQIVGITPDINVFFDPDMTEEPDGLMREETLYVNALQAQGIPWVQPRPRFVNVVERCMDQTGIAVRTYRRQVSGSPRRPDFQRLKALDAMKCLRP